MTALNEGTSHLQEYILYNLTKERERERKKRKTCVPYHPKVIFNNEKYRILDTAFLNVCFMLLFILLDS